MGVGKVFLTSRKFLHAEGGFRRVVWMPKDLKDLVGPDLRKRLQEQGCPDVFDKIADETVTSDAEGLRAFMEKVGHPALAMAPMEASAQAKAEEPSAETAAAPASAPFSREPSASESPSTPAPAVAPLTPDALAQLKAEIVASVKDEVRASLTQEIVRDIIRSLGEKFLGEKAAPGDALASGSRLRGAESTAANGAAVAPVAEAPAPTHVEPEVAEGCRAPRRRPGVRDSAREGRVPRLDRHARRHQGRGRHPWPHGHDRRRSRACRSTTGKARCRTGRSSRWKSSTS